MTKVPFCVFAICFNILLREWEVNALIEPCDFNCFNQLSGTMQSIKTFISEINRFQQKGQALVEYGFLSAIFSVAVLFGVFALGNQISKFYAEQSEQLEHMEATVEAYYATPDPNCVGAECDGTTPEDETLSYIKVNPGNSHWEVCLVTPSGTYNRDWLKDNPNFAYDGPASSLFFKPTAGGGDVLVNGQPYRVDNGNYYLFEGNLTVGLFSSQPGSMGHWEVKLESNAIPTFGKGNGKKDPRPTSPCE